MTRWESAVLAFRGEAALFINTRSRLTRFAAPSLGLCIRSPNSLAHDREGKPARRVLFVDSARNNVESKSPVLNRPPGSLALGVFPSHLSPPPARRALPFLPGRAGRCAPSPSLLLIGAQVGESPPRAYVRVRAVRAHLAFELRRFWLPFTSLPAFSARCCARQGGSGKRTGGGEGTTAVDTGEKRTREGEGGEGEKEELPALASKLPGHLIPETPVLGPQPLWCRQPPAGCPLLPRPSCPHSPPPRPVPGACLGAGTGMIS